MRWIYQQSRGCITLSLLEWPKDYDKNRNEFWCRSMFVMLLRWAGIISYSEPQTSKGRADVVIQFKNLTVVLEFKLSKTGASGEEKNKNIAEKEANRVKEFADGNEQKRRSDDFSGSVK